MRGRADQDEASRATDEYVLVASSIQLFKPSSSGVFICAASLFVCSFVLLVCIRARQHAEFGVVVRRHHEVAIHGESESLLVLVRRHDGGRLLPGDQTHTLHAVLDALVPADTHTHRRRSTREREAKQADTHTASERTSTYSRAAPSPPCPCSLCCCACVARVDSNVVDDADHELLRRAVQTHDQRVVHWEEGRRTTRSGNTRVRPYHTSAVLYTAALHLIRVCACCFPPCVLTDCHVR